MIIKLLSLLKQFALVVLLTYVTLITVLSLMSIGNLPSLGSKIDDKIYHFVAYTIMAFLFYNWFRRLRVKRAFMYAVIISAIYGIIIEVLQYKLNPDRTFDMLDILANSFGAFFGLWIILKLKTKLN